MTRRPRPVTGTPAYGDVATCAGKKPFFDKRMAKRRAEIRQDSGTAMRANRCTACGNWHLGHAPGQWTGLRHADRLYRLPDGRDAS